MAGQYKSKVATLEQTDHNPASTHHGKQLKIARSSNWWTLWMVIQHEQTTLYKKINVLEECSPLCANTARTIVISGCPSVYSTALSSSQNTQHIAAEGVKRVQQPLKTSKTLRSFRLLPLQSCGEREDESESAANNDRNNGPAGTRLDICGGGLRLMLVTDPYEDGYLNTYNQEPGRRQQGLSQQYQQVPAQRCREQRGQRQQQKQHREHQEQAERAERAHLEHRGQHRQLKRQLEVVRQRAGQAGQAGQAERARLGQREQQEHQGRPEPGWEQQRQEGWGRRCKPGQRRQRGRC